MYSPRTEALSVQPFSIRHSSDSSHHQPDKTEAGQTGSARTVHQVSASIPISAYSASPRSRRLAELMLERNIHAPAEQHSAIPIIRRSFDLRNELISTLAELNELASKLSHLAGVAKKAIDSKAPVTIPANWSFTDQSTLLTITPVDASQIQRATSLAESSQAGSSQTEPSQAESSQAGSSQTEPSLAEFSQAGSSQTEPSQSKSFQSKSSQTEFSLAESSQKEPSQAETDEPLTFPESSQQQADTQAVIEKLELVADQLKELTSLIYKPNKRLQTIISTVNQNMKEIISFVRRKLEELNDSKQLIESQSTMVKSLNTELKTAKQVIIIQKSLNWVLGIHAHLAATLQMELLDKRSDNPAAPVHMNVSLAGDDESLTIWPGDRPDASMAEPLASTYNLSGDDSEKERLSEKVSQLQSQLEQQQAQIEKLESEKKCLQQAIADGNQKTPLRSGRDYSISLNQPASPFTGNESHEPFKDYPRASRSCTVTILPPSYEAVNHESITRRGTIIRKPEEKKTKIKAKAKAKTPSQAKRESTRKALQRKKKAAEKTVLQARKKRGGSSHTMLPAKMPPAKRKK